MAKDDLPIETVLDDLQRGHRLLKGYERAIEVAQTIQGLGQAEKELTKSIEAKQKEIAALDKTISEGTHKVSVAHTEAEAILVKARQEAQVIISKAEDTAATETAEAKNKVLVANARLKTAEDKFADVNGQVEAKQNELNGINKELEDVRAKLRGF